MIHSARGNLLEAEAEALVNTVNTVGVMGKGIALMFKEAYPENFREYVDACKRGDVIVGKMFVTERHALHGARWIINFPTKKHWRGASRLEWVVAGLDDLRRVIEEKGIRSIAIPPLGTGNGGLDWRDVRPVVTKMLASLEDVDILLFEPTREYQNVAKRAGVEKLTPARALVAELVRRYWVLGIDCSLLEVQILAWLLQRQLERLGPSNVLALEFKADRYGPYSDALRHLLNSLDGSYLHCERRLADARPFDTIRFEDSKRPHVEAYLKSEAHDYLPALESATQLIDGFESPLGMELLGTIDWLLVRDHCEPNVASIRRGLENWPSGAERKLRFFDDRLISLALERIAQAN